MLEQLIGDGRWDGQAGIIRQLRREGGEDVEVEDQRQQQPLYASSETRRSTSSKDSDDAVREKILHLLSQFHLDNQFVSERVVSRYYKLYEHRRRQKMLQGSSNREKVALVFSICSVLHEEGIPRPVKQVAEVCGLPRSHCGRILKVRQELKLEEVDGKKGQKKAPEYKEAQPEDYISTLCLHLNVPFSVAQQAERMVQTNEVRWKLYGRKPQHLAGAAVEKVLLARGFPSMATIISRELGCSPTSVRKTANHIPNKLCWE